MFTEGIYPIGDGLLDIDETRLKGLLVPDDINEIYEVEQTPFARGKFAAVRRAVHKNSGVHFAAKFLKRRRRAQSSDKEIKHEIAVLTLCDGAENIVKLNAVHESRSDTALLLDMATGGELQTLLDNEECLNEAHARFAMREVLKALQFLHKRSIAHLDLKPQNILLSGERIEDGLKLCDFGISRVVTEGTQVREIIGTADYMAPESLQYEPLSLLSDIWSVGVLAYVLLTGFSPFGGDTKQETFLNISQCALEFPDKLFGGVSGVAIDFIRRALRIKPNDRMTAAGCLEHPWLTDECPMSRQIYIAKKKVTDEQEDGEDEADEEDEEEEDERVDHSLEDDDEDEEISTDEHSACVADEDDDHELSMPPAMRGDAARPMLVSNGIKAPVTSTATHVVVVTSPPGPRRQCNSDSNGEANKENTYLATKKITPSSSNTTTIIIGAGELKAAGEVASSSHITTVTVPSGSSSVAVAANGSDKSPCLFPDAPTTPKVIRKAPTSDSSPTSVKALVKKFQLEGGDCQLSPPAVVSHQTLKEAHGNHQHHQHQHQLHHHQQQQHNQLQHHQTNGKATIAIVTNGKCCVKVPEKEYGSGCTDAPKLKPKPKFHNANGSLSNGSSSNTTSHLMNGRSATCNYASGRRASEPAPGVHKTATAAAHQRNSTESAVMVNNFRSTCVYGVNSDGSVAAATTTTNTPNGCRHPSHLNGAQAVNGGSGDDDEPDSPSKQGAAAPTSTAILFAANHHTQLHSAHHTHAAHPHTHAHHHHHHHVAKNVAATNLSLDQGIIC